MYASANTALLRGAICVQDVLFEMYSWSNKHWKFERSVALLRRNSYKLDKFDKRLWNSCNYDAGRYLRSLNVSLVSR